MDSKTLEAVFIITFESYVLIGILLGPPARVLLGISKYFKNWGQFSRYYFFVYGMYAFLWPIYHFYWTRVGFGRKLMAIGAPS